MKLRHNDIYDKSIELFNFLKRSPTAYEVACFVEDILYNGCKTIHVDSMSVIETKRYNQWTKKHYNKCRPRVGWLVEYQYTGIGSGISVKCPKCGEVKDLTDISGW